jgi:hypothetical protein
MAGNVPGNFGLKKKPATLDFSGIIQKVEWILGPDILVLQFDWRMGLFGQTFGATSLSALGLSTIDPFAQIINEHDDFVPVPSIVNPMSKPMVAHTLAFNRPPFKRSGIEAAPHWKAILFFNLAHIKSFEDLTDPTYQITITTPPSRIIHETGFVHWIYYDPFGNPFEYYQAHPSTSGIVIDAEGHTAVFLFPAAIPTIEARDLYLSLNAGSLPPLRSFEEPTSSDRSDGFGWRIDAKTYRRRKDFPLGSELAPLWDVAEAKSSAFLSEQAVISTSFPARTVTVTVNFKTLAISMRKV